MDVIGVIRRKLTALLTQSISHQGQGLHGKIYKKAMCAVARKHRLQGLPWWSSSWTGCFHCWGQGSVPGRELGSCKPRGVAITENICKQTKNSASFRHQRNCSKGGSVVKNLPARAGDARDMHWILVLGRTPGGGNG